MSINPSNAVSEQITGRKPFPNLAGVGEHNPDRVDEIARAELEAAGITAESYDCLRDDNEPHTAIVGRLCLWTFTRAWYYWIAKGPGIPVEDAEALHIKHGTSVRVEGHCGCPAPLAYRHGFGIDLYHVDNQEGLNALAEVIRQVYDRGTKAIEQRKALEAEFKRRKKDLLLPDLPWDLRLVREPDGTLKWEDD
jgi:hypothetical protein